MRLHAIHGRDPSGPLAHTLRIVTLCALALLPPTGRAAAAPLSIGGGFDWFAGPSASSSRSGLVFGAAGLGGFDLFGAGMRFDHDAVGSGSGVTLGGGMPVAPLTQLRVTGTRFWGEGDYRAWRLKAGPRARLVTGAALGLYYTRDWNDGAEPIQGAIAEGEFPIVPIVTARATAGYATSDGVHSLLGSIGAGWSPAPHVLLSAEVGVTQDARLDARQPVAGSRGALGSLPIVGGGTPSSGGGEETRSAITTLVGIRVSLP